MFALLGSARGSGRFQLLCSQAAVRAAPSAAGRSFTANNEADRWVFRQAAVRMACARSGLRDRWTEAQVHGKGRPHATRMLSGTAVKYGPATGSSQDDWPGWSAQPRCLSGGAVPIPSLTTQNPSVLSSERLAGEHAVQGKRVLGRGRTPAD